MKQYQVNIPESNAELFILKGKRVRYLSGEGWEPFSLDLLLFAIDNVSVELISQGFTLSMPTYLDHSVSVRKIQLEDIEYHPEGIIAARYPTMSRKEKILKYSSGVDYESRRLALVNVGLWIEPKESA